MENNCDKHGLAKSGLCAWCGKAVCEECVTEAYDKNYCFTCLAKLPLDKLGTINSSVSARGNKNIDPTMTEKDVEEKRKAVEMQVASDKEMFQGLRNMNADKEETARLRKKYAEYKEMMERSGL